MHMLSGVSHVLYSDQVALHFQLIFSIAHLTELTGLKANLNFDILSSMSQ